MKKKKKLLVNKLPFMDTLGVNCDAVTDAVRQMQREAKLSSFQTDHAEGE